MRFADLLRRSAFALALVAAAASVAAWSYEKSGRLALRAKAELSEFCGEEIELDELELDWFRPAVRVRGLRFPGEVSPLHLGEVEVELAWRDGLRATRVDVRGGRVELSEALITRLEHMFASKGDGATPSAMSAGAPPIVLEHVLLDWVDPQWGATQLGWVDAVYREGVERAPEIQGRIRPSSVLAGDGQAAEVYLAGSRDAKGRITLRATCAGLPLSSDAIAPQSPLERVRAWKPRATLAFDLEANFQVDRSSPASGRLRAQASSGSLQPSTTSIPVTDIDVDLDADCAADTLVELLNPRHWTSTAHASARWSGIPFEAWALFGRNAGVGHSASAWIHAPRLPLARSTTELAGSPPALLEIFDALDLTGTADILCGVRWPESESITDDSIVASPEIAIEIDPRGDATVCTYGWLDGTGTRRDGFPMRVKNVTGRVVILHDASHARATLIGILEILSAHSDGTVARQPGFAHGLIVAPARAGDYPSFDLSVGGHGIPVDAAMDRGLRGIHGAEFIFPEFSPSGGTASIYARLVRRPGFRYPAADVLVELFGVGGSWRELPIQLRNVDGRIEFRADPRGFVATGFDLRARTRREVAIDVRGRIQDVPDPALQDGPWHLRHFETVAVDVRGMALRGDDRDALASAIPEIAEVLDDLAPNGRADISYRGATPAPGAPREWSTEVIVRDAELLPSQFPVPLQKVRGRVLVQGAMPIVPSASGEPNAPTVVRVAPLLGEWTRGNLVVADAVFSTHDDGAIEIHASGVEPTNGGLSGAFSSAGESGLGGGHAGLALSGLRVDGRVDFSGRFTIPRLSPRAPESDYRVFLRQNDVRTTGTGGRLSLGRLVGMLEQTPDGVLAGESITATLAGTPIQLSGARFEQRGTEFRIETAIDALEVGIDREHLTAFLDDRTLDALLGDLGWRGEVDVRNARLSLTGSPEAGERAEFSGDVVPRNMSIDLGVPIVVHSAKVRIVGITYENNAVRAVVEVQDLDGLVADRRLEQASFDITYEDPRLRVTDLEGNFESGRVRGADRTSVPDTAFEMDVAAPYRFQLSLDLANIEVAGLLRGLFESDFASRGDLSGRLHLEGDLARLTGVRGSGNFEIEDTVLWSVPVVRDLLSQLGIGYGSVFRHVEARLEFADGRVRMNDLLVESPLIKLVGNGTLDFDGSLEHDLEVQYQILDWLGWFNRVIYWIQNSLVRVAVRGDMARPRVVTKGAFGRSIDPRRGPRDLPLPNLSPLPERF